MTRQADGEILAGYRLEGVLGRGASGVVYRAWQDDLERPVALKVMGAAAGADATLLRFRREVAALTRLDHWGFPRLLDCGSVELEGDRHLYLATDMVRGTPFPLHVEGLGGRARLQLLAALCDVVQHAHARGVVHGDLKPDNLVVDDGGQVHILDLGLASQVGVEAPLGMAPEGGTLPYAPPEAAGGARPADPRRDVHALGILAGELLAEPSARRGLRGARALRGVLARATAAAPAERYFSAGALGADLRRVLRGEPVAVRAAGRLGRLRRAAARGRGFVRALAVMVTALLAAILATAWAEAEAAGARRRLEAQSSLILGLSDHLRLDDLEERAARLDGRDLPSLDTWLEEATHLAGRAAVHRAALSAWRLDPGEGVDAGARQWMDEALGALIARLERFDDPDPHAGIRSAITRRRDWLAHAEVASVRAHDAAWDQARAAIAASPRYGGLHIEPQVGLVPLGPDPASGLWEFLHLGSEFLTRDDEGWHPAPPPGRDATGHLALDADTGCVLVLLPGGDALMGAQDEDPEGLHYDPEVGRAGPPHSVSLAPFFAGKHEVTQAQWMRLTGGNPSHYDVGWTHAGVTVTPRNPVEWVNWTEAEGVLRRHGLRLPTEAQWEYLARGGTTTIWSTGDTVESLAGAANTRDRAAAIDSSSLRPLLEVLVLDDGHAVHAPVGSFAPNPFGLLDVHGNVAEWCLDVHESGYGRPARPGDGLRGPLEASPDSPRIVRGGSYHVVEAGRSARRDKAAAHMRLRTVGLRAVRPLGGDWSRDGEVAQGR